MSGFGMRILYYEGSEDDPNIQFIDASLEGLGESAHIEVNGERVELSEVESAAVDEDGYMLLLGNTSDYTDYIWKTPINIEDIGAGLGD